MLEDGDNLTLKVDGEALEEEMECELEDETVQDTERVRSISNPGQPSKKEREEHEATHAQYRSWGRGVCMCETWNRDEAPQEHTGAGSDEGSLHTFVMVCFPSQGRDHQRIQDQGDQHVHGFEQRRHNPFFSR